MGVEMEKVVLNPDVYVIKNFLTKKECTDFIAKREDIGFEEATVTTREGQKMIKGIRNNQRVIIKNQILASTFWNRIEPFISERFESWIPISVNEQFRIYKYALNERFNKHRDGRFVRSEDEESRLTLMVYLNEGFEGGETEFDDFSVVPELGTALIFKHEVRHKGCKVLSGLKYAIRTDIIFKNRSDDQEP